MAVLLTGMGKDGLCARETIRSNHGLILIQDEVSIVVWGMPGVVAHAGLADSILQLSPITGEIQRRLQVEHLNELFV